MKHFSNKKATHRSCLQPAFWCLLMVAMMTGCSKWDDLTSPKEGSVYMPQAYSNRSKLTVYKIDSAQEYTFGASIAGFNGAPSNMTVDFEIDTSLIQQFNMDHAYLNYNFVALPKDAYTISSLSSNIEKGKSDSDPLSISILASKLDPSLDYCLPIRIKSLSAGSVDSVLSTSYFMVDSLYIRMRDITSNGMLAVSKDNNDGADSKEGSKKLTDNDYGTKFLYEFEKDSWMQLKLGEAAKLNAYTITSGNDADDRDAKDWQFQGSNDGNSWKVLDERKDYKFTGRTQTVTFELNQPDDQPYLYYRLLVNENNSSDLLQITEWRLIQYY